MRFQRRWVVYLGLSLLAAAILFTVLLATRTSSGTAPDTGSPISCSGPHTCLSLAGQYGLRGHLLTPSSGVRPYAPQGQGGRVVPPNSKGSKAVEVDLAYRDLKSGQL